MATLRCDHPDVEAFITAKRTPGRLTNFNVSVLITDKFMEAVENDGDWALHFTVPRTDRPERENAFGIDGVKDLNYIYKKLPARDLWNLILKNTYEHAEPGVIFIDRVNELNNLNYAE